MDAKTGQPINLSKDRAAKIRIGGQECFVWCDTYRGRLRLRVCLPDGGEVEHIKLRGDNPALATDPPIG